MIKSGLTYNSWAYFCEMGTGKSKVIADIIGTLHKAKRIMKVLIVAPKSLLLNWAKELTINISNIKSYKKGVDTNMFLCYNVIMEKTQRKKCDDLQKDVVNIINYEALLKVPEAILESYDMVVLDESSKIKNPQAKITKKLLKISSSIKYKYILSGTPITNNPVDIYSQLYFLDPNVLKFKNFYSFKSYYCQMGGYGNYQIVGYRHLAQLKSNISTISTQLKKEDCLDLPEKSYTTRDISMSLDMKKQYDSMKKDMILELEDEKITAQIAIVKLGRLQQILGGGFLPDQNKNNKLKELDLILNEMSDDKQIIIFARYINSIKLLEKWVKDKGFTASVIYGDVKDRQKQIDDFQSGKNRFFIGQITTAGFGITLTNASYCIYYENNFSLQDRLQSEARLHRIGLTHPVTYIDMVYKDTIEKDILKVVTGKEKTANYLVESFLRRGGKNVEKM